jgi:hypothetical protein
MMQLIQARREPKTEALMTVPPSATTTTILSLIARSSGCNLEDIVFNCRELTWNQVFLEVDRLSRSGQVCLTQQRPGYYIVTPPTARKGLL